MNYEILSDRLVSRMADRKLCFVGSGVLHSMGSSGISILRRYPELYIFCTRKETS